MQKYARTVIFLLICLLWVLPEGSCLPLDKEDGDRLFALESAILSEMNLARSDPVKYASYVKDLGSRYRGIFIYLSGSRIKNKEGMATVDEAIRFLGFQKPLPALKLSKGLSVGAADRQLSKTNEYHIPFATGLSS